MEHLWVILAALGAALCFGFNQVCARVGFAHTDTTTALVLTIGTSSLVLFLTLGPFITWNDPPLWVLSLFMLAGIISPLATQLLLYVSVPKIGITRASPLRNTTPLFAGVIAIIFLGERWTFPLLFGTVLIVIGATFLGMRESKAPQAFDRRYLLVPLLAGFLGGFGVPLRKYAFSYVTSVPLAACTLSIGAILGLAVYLLVTGKYRELVVHSFAVRWFSLAGILSGLAVIGNLTALQMGRVVIVAPLVATVPLFTIILSAVFLRSLERVTWRIVVGAACICFGTIVLIVF